MIYNDVFYALNRILAATDIFGSQLSSQLGQFGGEAGSTQYYLLAIFIVAITQAEILALNTIIPRGICMIYRQYHKLNLKKK